MKIALYQLPGTPLDVAANIASLAQQAERAAAGEAGAAEGQQLPAEGAGAVRRDLGDGQTVEVLKGSGLAEEAVRVLDGHIDRLAGDAGRQDAGEGRGVDDLYARG